MARRTKYTAEQALGMVLGDLDDNYDGSGDELSSDNGEDMLDANFGDSLDSERAERDGNFEDFDVGECSRPTDARRSHRSAVHAIASTSTGLDTQVVSGLCYPTSDTKKLKCIVAFHNICIFADFASAYSNFLG